MTDPYADKPTRPGPRQCVWCDNRGSPGLPECFEHARLRSLFLLWMQDNEPEVFAELWREIITPGPLLPNGWPERR